MQYDWRPVTIRMIASKILENVMQINWTPVTILTKASKIMEISRQKIDFAYLHIKIVEILMQFH